jgi:2-polyprenyl-3-methyl-5-hydroxy-6-metoxy-1,4-benzoquinol methylase
LAHAKKLLSGILRLFAISSAIRKAAMNGRLQLLVRALRNPVIGYTSFAVNVVLKNVALFFGGHDQRAAEYPWILRQLAFLAKGSVVLDVGCSESILSHALVMRGFAVFGLDVRDYPFRSKYMTFVRRNMIASGLPDNFFDAILVCSTIEHVGLNVYQQIDLDSSLDARAVHELARILKPGAAMMVTTPFVGNVEDRITSEERQYGFEGLKKLFDGLDIVREDYFYPYHYGHLLRWIQLCRGDALKVTFAEPGIACLVLRKPHDPRPTLGCEAYPKNMLSQTF